MTKAKRKKLNDSSEPMEIDQPTENGNDIAESDDEDDYDHISDDEEGGIRIGDIYIPPAPKPALTFDATGPRMIITHIENENFKSYAGKQFLGPFHKSFSAIIGPNGSGKSNVIDSMLFVFGYRASKIRSKKISVLIHSSSKYPNVQSATVSVHFCQIIDGEADTFEIVAESEIVVSRTAFKDNSSHYTLNGRRVQFKEVARLLKNFGIDLDHNRFLILQGEVEQISMMKPKALTPHEFGMLEYLEDIIGTSRYKKPIEKLSDRVEELSESRKEKLNRVRLVEAEKQKLEQPMREAVELMNLTNHSLRTRNMLLQKYIFEINKIVEEKKNDRSVIELQLNNIDERLQVISTEMEEKNAVLMEGTKKYDVLHKEKESLSEKLQSTKKNMVTVQANNTQSNKKKKNLDQLLEQERGKLIDLELIPDKNKREIEDCEKLLIKHNEGKLKAEQELQTVVAGVRTQTQGLQETKDRLQAKQIGLKRIVDEANRTFRLAESELKIYLSTEQKETEKLEKMKDTCAKVAADLKEKKRIQQELSATLPDNERELKQLQAQLQDIRREEANVSTDTRTLRSQLEESRQAMSANRSRGRVLDSLMREKHNGNLPGIFGRMGDLGGIDLKYDVAISTCCGALDNIVVDSVETAQACVEHLKRHDIGRATFIALDKQTHLRQQYERRAKFPENVPRLFDLIKVKDERVKPAFYYALRDTLVATDLEQASRIAYGATRYRVVTLQGDVIEIAGTMSGGGRSTMRGRMSSSVQQDTSDNDPAVVQANERKLAALEQRLSELRSQQANIEDTVGTLERTVREGKITLDKIKIELRSLTEQVPLIQNQIKQQEMKAANSRVDEYRKAELEGVVEEARQEMDKAKHDAGEVEKEVHGVDAQINAIAGGRVKDMQKIVVDFTTKISKVSTEVNKLKVAINASVRNAKKAKDKITVMESDLAETVSNLENLAAKKRQLTIDNTKLAKDLEEVEEKINDGVGEFSDLKKEIAKLQNKENKIKSERLECQNNLKKIDKSIEDCMAKSPVWERELRQLKLEDAGVEGVPGLEPPTPLATHTTDELESVTVEDLRVRHQMQCQRIGDDRPDVQAVLDFQTKEALYLKRAQELEEITTKRNEMRALFDQLKKKRQTDFLSGFNTITMKLKEMYQMITLGGDAELELVDSLDPFTEGIIFSVRPPNKSWKNISNLSGGEKTLSSLALVFALHYYKPTPLYVMDEIDAALDFKNVSIVANYIKERTKNAQFIIISLRYIMFEASNRLVGIYKTQDCTKCVTVNNKLPSDEDIDN